MMSRSRKRQPPHYHTATDPPRQKETFVTRPAQNPTPESRNLGTQPPTASSKAPSSNQSVTNPRPQNPSCRNGQQPTLPSTSQSNPGRSGQQIASNCFFLRVNQMPRIGSEACHLQTNLTNICTTTQNL